MLATCDVSVEGKNRDPRLSISPGIARQTNAAAASLFSNVHCIRQGHTERNDTVPRIRCVKNHRHAWPLTMSYRVSETPIEDFGIDAARLQWTGQSVKVNGKHIRSRTVQLSCQHLAATSTFAAAAGI